MNSYGKTIEFLYGARLFGMKLGLQNIRHILDRLGCPEKRFFTVHIAGTNGKGSVAAKGGIEDRAFYVATHLVLPGAFQDQR